MKPNGWGYEWIKELQKELRVKEGRKRPILDLLALDRNNDPFYQGSEKDLRHAEWFRKAWSKCSRNDRNKMLHIRRVHYFLQSTGKYLKLDRTPYLNNDHDWQWLLYCSKSARVLGTVDVELFVDQRNDDVGELHWRGRPAVGIRPDILPPLTDWKMPSIDIEFANTDWRIEDPPVVGYSPNDYADRHYYIEVWAEKGTVSDIVAPILSDWSILYLVGQGYQSITNNIALLKRINVIGKPARIFYISDYDPAGRNMPVSTARWLEFWRRRFAPESDIKLIPMVLTKEQAAGLPSTGDGRVELDALVALQEGRLEEIVRSTIGPYVDETVDAQLQDTADKAEAIVRRDWMPLAYSHRRSLTELEKRVRRVTRKYQREAKRINKRMQRELRKFSTALKKLRGEVARIPFAPELPERPQQLPTEQDESNVMFDARREYMDQIAYYKRQKGLP